MDKVVVAWDEENPWKWSGDWDAPGHGSYVILERGKELEPYEVIAYIERLHDLLEQMK